MGIAIDVSSPSVVTGNPTATTASFTPPADSLLLILFSGNDAGATLLQPTITDSLGAHLTYTRHQWYSRHDSGLSGQVAIWTAEVGASPSAMTVSVTNNDGAGARQCGIKVHVLTGQETTDPIGVNGGAASSSASAIAQGYTAEADNGQGFLVVCDWDVVGLETAGSGCTLDGSGTIPTNQLTYGFARRAVADDSVGGLTTLNMNLPGTSTNLHWAWIEILEFVGDPPEKDPPPFIMWHPPGEGMAPNGILNPWMGTDNAAPDDVGLRIHESSPMLAVNTVATTTACTTLSFTPPAGSLLLVLWAGNSVNAVNPSTPTITDSLGSPLTYTLTDWQSRADSPTVDGQAAAWTAPVVSSAPMTVTVNNNAASGTRHAAMQVLVLINEAGSPIGAHGKAGSASAAIIAQTYTAQANLGQGFIAVADWANTGTPTAGMNCYLAEDASAGQIVSQLSYGFFKRTIPDDVNTVANRLNVQLAGTANAVAWVYVEILPTAGAQIEAATGDGSAGPAAYGTAVKVAPITATCTAGGFARATVSQGVDSRAQTGTCTAGVQATATAVKKALPAGTALSGACATTAVVKRALPTGPAAAGAASTTAVVKRATPLARAAAAASSTGAVGKRATPVGSGTAGASSTGTARHVTARTGTGLAGATGTATARHVAPRTGPALAGSVSTGAARHVAPRAAIGTSGTSATGAAAKKTAAIGSGFAGATSTHSGVSTRAVLGRCAAGASSTGGAGHIAARAATTASGGACTGTAVHRTARSGVTCVAGSARAGALKVARPAGSSQAGLSATAVGRKKAPATGTSCAGAIGTVVSTARPVTGRSFAGVIARHRQLYTYRPVTGTTARPDVGDTARPGSGTTTRPGSGLTLRPVTTLTERP